MPDNTAAKYFARYLKVAPLSHALWRSVEAQELAKYKLEKPILDLGCGFGEFAGVFFSSQIEVGLDIDEKEIEKAAQGGKYKKTVIADARNLPFGDNSFQTIISVSTLEHIPDNFQVFKEAKRVLKPGGKFIFMSPAEEFMRSLLLVKFLNFLGLGKVSEIYCRLLNRAFKHVFIPPEKTWVSQTTRAGLQIEKVEGTIPRIALWIWEAGLIFALPSQITKLIFGSRLVLFPKLRFILFKPLIPFIKSDPNFRANIVVVATKPK